MSLGRLAVLAFSLTLLPHLVWAAIVNRTIDDSSGDAITGAMPDFLPNISTWNDHTCAGCRIQPDVNRAFGNSWHETTYNPQRGRQSIVIPFNGTAIYVFFILVNNAGSGITTETECNFVLNNEQPVPYRHEPNTSTTNILYNQLVFSRKDLPQRQHLLEVVMEGYDYNVYLNFDYAIYTHDDTPPTTSSTTGGAPSSTSNSNGSQGSNSSSGTPVGAIAGGVVGGILFILAAFLLFFCLRRRRKQKELKEYQRRPGPLTDELNQSQYRVEPFTQQNAYHRGPSSSAVGNSSEPLYSPVPQQSQHKFHGSFSALPSSMPSSSEYSSSYPGIATTRYTSDSDQATSVTGSSGAGGTQYNAGAASAAAVASTGTYPREKGNRSANPPLPPLPAGSSRVILTVSNPEEQEQVRQVRQAEIGERLRTVEQEMNDLKRGFSQRRPAPQRATPRQGNDEREDVIVQMREQMMEMQQEIQVLRENQRSDWAMGLTDEPPPGYTANPTPRPVSGQQHS